jgi:3-carboxy-cis,cis-muconate cycloisomerase
VMMGLAPAIGRHHAHEVVYDACREVAQGQGSLLEVLARDARVSQHLSRTQIAALLEPVNYLGSATQMVDRCLARG